MPLPWAVICYRPGKPSTLSVARPGVADPRPGRTSHGRATLDAEALIVLILLVILAVPVLLVIAWVKLVQLGRRVADLEQRLEQPVPARGEANPRYQFAEPGADYQRFAEQFPFELTPDQRVVLDRVRPVGWGRHPGRSEDLLGPGRVRHERADGADGAEHTRRAWRAFRAAVVRGRSDQGLVRRYAHRRGEDRHAGAVRGRGRPAQVCRRPGLDEPAHRTAPGRYRRGGHRGAGLRLAPAARPAGIRPRVAGRRHRRVSRRHRLDRHADEQEPR